MKRLLMSCEQVFDVLTRGPFPTGEPSDESVEHHLRACHECRRLAEALRPAVAVLHEAVSADQAIDLPEYQGTLPFRRPLVRKLSMARLAGPPRGKPAVASESPARTSRDNAANSSVRLIAASLLVVGLATWLWALTSDTRSRARSIPDQALRETWTPARDGVPGASGLMTLANLRLPSDCLPLSHRPLSGELAAELALAMHDGSLAGLKCCTECHHAGPALKANLRSSAIARTTQQQCQVCHRG